MTSIKLESLKFDDELKFRKFKDVTIPFSRRLTLICGHNGTGKSTILGLIASLSGLHDSPALTYGGKQFEANISEIIYIDFETEGLLIKSQPTATYNIDGVRAQKKCTLTTPRTKLAGRARSVPRTPDGKDFDNGRLKFGAAQKMPLPTIYLGMVRMIPLGEVTDGRIINDAPQDYDQIDIDDILQFTDSVIRSHGAAEGQVKFNAVKATKKNSAVPDHPHHSRSVSLGQDSLGGIANALASFRRLKRKMKETYPGGLLIIDEMDAGFHPHAIGALVKALRKQADELSLQIIATTHSTRLIEAIHPDGPSRDRKDGVVYLKGTRNPKYDADMSLQDILEDMDLTRPVHVPPPDVRVYFEDDEACEAFEVIMTPELIAKIEREQKVNIKPMPLGIGCTSLAMLPSKDDYFTSVVLVADADGSRPRKLPDNLVDLPSELGSDNKPLSPERTLIKFIRDLIDNDDDHVDTWANPALKGVSTNRLEEVLLRDVDLTIKREAAKTWWRDNRVALKKWKLYELWCSENMQKVKHFQEAFAAAVPKAVKAQGALKYKHLQRH